MRVIIAGGGISGLALAGSLEKAGIDYVLLEARDCVDPQVGASIAINAGSMRVLDQLGAADEIIDQTTPITTVNHHNPDGTFISPSGNDWVLLGARFFYETAFMDRQLALRAMANSIHQKEKILLKQRVKSVDHTDTGVTVHCEDGSSFSGDVLIGCDGVNSKTRSEMWRIANKAEPGYFDAAEKTKMTAEYSCLVGISTGMDKMGMTVGDVDYVYDKGKSFLVFCGKNGRSFWFFFQKMNKIYNRNDPDFPRFTKEDAEQIAVENGWRPCHSKLKFRDLWNNRFSYALVPMEECLYEKWSWGRMAVVGDGSHKMTANHGAAGNNAIESAIAMANSLQRIHDRGDLSTSTIRKTFIEWQQKRQARIDDTVKAAAMICRMHGQATWKDRLMVYWVMPNANSLLSNIYRDQIIGAEILEYLPVPERSFLGNTPFNPVRGIGFEVDVMKRALFALPLLAIWFCMYRFSAGPALTSFVEASRDTDTAQWMRVLLYPADVGLIYAIWLIEGARLGNELSLMQV
jgi:2-polyprenyl-6-methoxyphenol hydroxylase-like FAD-dependent oxidoreductase